MTNFRMSDRSDPSQFIGNNPAIREIMAMARKVARFDIPVLICGESGTGKEILARFIHAKSRRSAAPFLKVDCASIPTDLLESELFGFEKGSFTHAFQRKRGKFELAHKGTIFLDEIGEMPLRSQPKLTHALQDEQFARLGAREETSVDVRLMAATNRPLEKLIAEGRFREDLYYRLNVVTFQLPALRDRKDDIPRLAAHFLQKHWDGTGPKPGLSAEVIGALADYDWPGNVRELENIIRNFLAVKDESSVLQQLRSEPSAEFSADSASVIAERQILPLKKAASLAAHEAEREMILLALHKTNWNRKRAAEMLQISYKAMLYKLKAADLVKRPEAYNASDWEERVLSLPGEETK